MRKKITCQLSLIPAFYIVPNFQPPSNSKQVVGTGGNRSCHLNLKHFGFTSTPPELLLKTASFLSYLFLVFHTVTNFQPSSGSKQFVGTGGNDRGHVNFKHFGFTSTLSRLLQKELTFLLSLILLFYIVPNFQPSSSSKQGVGTGGNRSCHLNLKQFGLTSTPPGLLLKTASFLSYLILVFHIVTNFQPSSNSKQFFGTGGNRYLLLRLDKLWRENYTTKSNAEENYLSVILNPRLLHCTQFSTLVKLKTSRWHRRESIPVT